MSNWRKPVIYALLFANKSQLAQNFRQIQHLARQPYPAVQRFQEEHLVHLLQHAWKYVPYYHNILETAGIIERGQVHLERFQQVPILTKAIIRQQGERLYAADRHTRRPYINTSGGSTGEPVRLIQDQPYADWNIANTLYYRTFVGQELGDLEIRLWGSERDILEGRESWQRRLRDFLYNRIDVNAFRMTPADMRRFVELLNDRRPPWIEAYAQPMYEFAGFVKQQGLRVPSPKGILTSAGTLYPFMRERIAGVFQCPVFNRYGSREVGGIACTCEYQNGLHLSPWNHYVEILDEQNQPVPPGGTGRVHITLLHNYAMPLIRYALGDMAVQAKDDLATCHCGRSGMPLIDSVRGRDVSLFKTRDGALVDGEFFTHLFYLKPWCQKFQVIQTAYDQIVMKIVLTPNSLAQFQQDQPRLIQNARAVMGASLHVDFNLVDDIPPNPSGKFAYTLCEVP